MLVDHADAPRDGIRGRGPDALLSGNEDLPGVGLQHAVKDLHGGGFACAVFPDDAVNRAGLDAQVHASVGQHGAELLRQPAQLDCRSVGGRHDLGSVWIWPRESTLWLGLSWCSFRVAPGSTWRRRLACGLGRRPAAMVDSAIA